MPRNTPPHPEVTRIYEFFENAFYEGVVSIINLVTSSIANGLGTLIGTSYNTQNFPSNSSATNNNQTPIPNDIDSGRIFLATFVGSLIIVGASLFLHLFIDTIKRTRNLQKIMNPGRHLSPFRSSNKESFLKRSWPPALIFFAGLIGGAIFQFSDEEFNQIIYSTAGGTAVILALGFGSVSVTLEGYRKRQHNIMLAYNNGLVCNPDEAINMNHFLGPPTHENGCDFQPQIRLPIPPRSETPANYYPPRYLYPSPPNPPPTSNGTPAPLLANQAPPYFTPTPPPTDNDINIIAPHTLTNASYPGQDIQRTEVPEAQRSLSPDIPYNGSSVHYPIYNIRNQYDNNGRRHAVIDHQYDRQPSYDDELATLVGGPNINRNLPTPFITR